MQFARLRPHNGKTNKLRTYLVFGIKFEEAKGWYEVDDAVAAYLDTVTQNSEDPDSGAAFDVVESRDEAVEIDERERKKTIRALAADAQPTVRVHLSGKGNLARAHRLKTGEKLDPETGAPVAPLVLDATYPGGGTVTTGRNGADHRAKTARFFDDNETELASAEDGDAAFDRIAAASARASVPGAARAIAGGGGGRGVEGTASSGPLSTATKLAGSEDDDGGDDGHHDESKAGKKHKNK